MVAIGAMDGAIEIDARRAGSGRSTAQSLSNPSNETTTPCGLARLSRPMPPPAAAWRRNASATCRGGFEGTLQRSLADTRDAAQPPDTAANPVGSTSAPKNARAMEGGPRRPVRRVSLRASPAAAGERGGGFRRCGSVDLLPFCQGRPSGTDRGFTIAPVPVGRPSGRRVAGRPAPERGAVAPFAWVGLQADTSPADLPPSARRSRRSRGSAFRPTPCRPGRYACTAHGRPERPAAGIPAGMRECGERRRPCDPCALLHSVRIGTAGPRAGWMRFGLVPLFPRK